MHPRLARYIFAPLPSILLTGALYFPSSQHLLAHGVALTFDDDYIDEWASIRPLLDELKVKATFYISGYHRMDADERALVRALHDDGHEIAAHGRDHANAQTYCPKNASRCTISPLLRAEAYVKEQIVPQLGEFAADGIYPRNFAYPYGADFPATTALLRKYFGYVRDTSYYPRHGNSYVSCDGSRFIAGLGIDHQYGLSYEDYDDAFASAVADRKTLILYAHRIEKHPNLYYTDEERLRRLVEMAQRKGLAFKRVKDICSWQAFALGGAWANVYDSPRAIGDVVFADFNGDGADDVFRTTGSTWEVMFTENGVWGDQGYWKTINRSAFQVYDLGVADFDGNGKADVLRSSDGYWFISYDGTGQWQRVRPSDKPLESLRFADFDGDGAVDVFTSTNGRWLVSPSARGAWTQINTSSYNGDRLRVGDFDGDQRGDVFVSDEGKWFVSSGGTESWTEINRSSYRVDQLSLSDLDGDGRIDIVRADGARMLVSFAGRSKWTIVDRTPVSLHELAFADIDGDGADEALRVAEKLIR